MSTRSDDYLEAISHLEAGESLVFQNVEWEEYEQLVENLDWSGLRVSYEEGRLEIVGPLPEHEDYKEVILSMARVLAEEPGIPLETRGSATWKRRSLRKGTEADTCFYVANAVRIIGKRRIDLETDPPPDIVVEIVTTNASLRKFSIYAALSVPEIWRYDGTIVQFYQLSGDRYQHIAESAFFPRLTPAQVTAVLEQSKTDGQTAALAAFRRRLRSMES